MLRPSNLSNGLEMVLFKSILSLIISNSGVWPFP